VANWSGRHPQALPSVCCVAQAAHAEHPCRKRADPRCLRCGHDGDGRLTRCSAPERMRSIADSRAVGGTHNTGCRARFSMFSSRGRRPPCLLLLHALGTALGGQPSAPARRLIETPPPRRAPSAAHGLYLHTVASCARRRAVYHPGVVRRPAVCGVLCGTYNT
jgi:hypothetical protein